MKIKYLSTKEVCDVLNTTKMTVCRMVKNGKLRPVNHHKFHLFDSSEIQLFKAQMQFLKDFKNNKQIT